MDGFHGCPMAPVEKMALLRAADRGRVFGLVLRRAAQTPYRIGRLSATLASHATICTEIAKKRVSVQMVANATIRCG